jgi:hypothetical protein
MTTTSEPDIRRLAYLHEAGHAVVALELGLQVVELVCDGEDGHCDAELGPQANAALMQAAKANCEQISARVETFGGSWRHTSQSLPAVWVALPAKAWNSAGRSVQPDAHRMISRASLGFSHRCRDTSKHPNPCPYGSIHSSALKTVLGTLCESEPTMCAGSPVHSKARHA